MVTEIKDKAKKKEISRNILEALTEWFEVEESREQYIAESEDRVFFAAEEGHHREGIGRKLVEKAKEAARASGYSFMQVKTVQMGKYEEYDRTNLFYISCGFREFEVFPDLWDEANPCQIYVMSL